MQTVYWRTFKNQFICWSVIYTLASNALLVGLVVIGWVETYVLNYSRNYGAEIILDPNAVLWLLYMFVDILMQYWPAYINSIAKTRCKWHED